MTARPYSLLRRTLLLCTAVLAVFLVATSAASFTVSYKNAAKRQDKVLEEVVGIISRNIVNERSIRGDGIPASRRGGFTGPGSQKYILGKIGGFYGPGSPDFNPGLPDLAALTMGGDDFEDNYQLDDRNPSAGMTKGDIIAVRLLHGGGQAVFVRADRDYSDGANTMRIYGKDYRVYLSTLADGTHVAAAQKISTRDKEIMTEALQASTPLLLLSPVILLVLGWVLWNSLGPLKRTEREVADRTTEDLNPIATAGLPREVATAIDAINGLLARVRSTREREKRFVGDAAHELRSPMAALSLQAERLEAMELPPEARKRVADLRQGIDRAVSLTTDLLALKRAEAGAASMTGCDCEEAITSIVEDLFWSADERGVALSVEGAGGGTGLHAKAGLEDVGAMLRNIVANAVRHSPEGGTVTVSLSDAGERVRIDVADTGSGIPEEERGRVFTPFYRAPGSAPGGTGLGLAIVAAIASRTGTEVSLSWTDEAARKGLTVSLLLPRAAPKGHA